MSLVHELWECMVRSVCCIDRLIVCFVRIVGTYILCMISIGALRLRDDCSKHSSWDDCQGYF